MFRIGMPSLASLSAVACLTLCGCMDEAAKQHGEAVKAIDAAAVRLGMLSPDINAAAKEAQAVLNALRSIDVQSGPLASVRSALAAKAQLVLGEASLEAGVVSRRAVATLGGRIEARLQSLQRLQSFADHARFTPTQLGFDALEQSMDYRSGQRRTHETQIDALQQEIDHLQTQHDTDARRIAHARRMVHDQRTAALHTGAATAIPDLEEAGDTLASLAPMESRLELLDIEIGILEDRQRQLQLVVDGESSTIEGLESESTDLREFITARNGQIDSMQDRIQTLRRDLVTDAAALASAETGPLQDTSQDAMEHFDAAATEARRAARQAGRNAMADRVLELAARQSALTTAITRYLSLNRHAALLDRLASQGDLVDAAAVREQARALTNQRDDAMEQARTAAQAALDVADQLNESATAESIRARLGSMQDLLDGKPITVPELVVADTDGMPPQPTPPDGGDGEAPAEAATTFIKTSALAGLGDTDAAAQAKALSDCATTPGICEGLDLAVQLLPAMASLNTLAAQTFTGPEAMGIQQIRAMMDPQMLQGMVAPMMAMMTATTSTLDDDSATVQFQIGQVNLMSITLGMTDGTWLVTGGTHPQGAIGDAASVAAAQTLLDQIAAVRTEVKSGQLSSATAYLQRAQQLVEAFKAINGQ